jgi:hypothetical protein
VLRPAFSVGAAPIELGAMKAAHGAVLSVTEATLCET